MTAVVMMGVTLAVMLVGQVGCVGGSDDSTFMLAPPAQHHANFVSQPSAFEAWVHGLVLALPDVRDVHAAGWRVDFVDGNCTDFTFEAIARPEGRPHDHSEPVHVRVEDVATNCTARWIATSPAGTKSHGPAILDVSRSDVTFVAEQDQCHHTPCLRAKNVTSSFNVTDLELKDAPPQLQLIFEIARPVAIAGFEVALDVAVDAAVDAVVDVVGSGIQSDLQYLVDTYAINATAAPPIPLAPDAVDLRDDGFISMVEYVANTVFANSTDFNVNQIISIITNGTNAIDISDLAQNFTYVLERNNTGSISLALDSVRVSDLDSIATINMMQPVSASRVTSRLVFDGLCLQATFAYNATLHGPALNSSAPLVENGSFTAVFSSLAGTVDLDFDISTTRLHELYAESYYKPGCLASAVRDAAVSLIATSFAFENATLVVADDVHLDTLVSDILALAIHPFVPALPKVLNYVYNGPVRNALNEYVQEWLFKSTQCVNTQPEFWSPSIIAGGGGVLVFVIVVLLLRLQRPTAAHMTALSINGDNDAAAGDTFNSKASNHLKHRDHTGSAGQVAGVLGGGDNVLTRLNAKSKYVSFGNGNINSTAGRGDSGGDRSVVEAKRQRVPLLSGVNCEPLEDLYETYAPCFGNEAAISTAMRYGMPIMIIFTIVLLVMSQSRIAGSAFFNVHYNHTDFRMPVVKTLLFTRTVQDMWSAHVYVLVACIVVFSGAWPHIKLVMMLYAWVAPVAWLPVQRRELFLQVLDFLGKWSIMDIYVSIMLLVGLHLHVPLANEHVTGPAYIDLWVETRPAVFYYWTTIMLSLMLTHVMLHVHRTVVHTNARLTPMTTEKAALCGHHFYSKGRFFVLTLGGKLFLAFCIAVTLGAIIFGIQTTAFTFRFKGLAAWLIAYTGGSDDRSLSVWEMAVNFPHSAQHPNSGSARFVQVVFTVFAVALPVALQLILSVLWFVPMRPTAHARVFHITEIVHAWAALEVFVLAVIVALLQLRPLAQFIIGDKCTGINALLRILFDSELKGNDKCFDVETELDTGSFVLIGCSVFSVLLTLATLTLSSHAVKERNGLVSLRKRKAITFILGSSSSSSSSATSSRYSSTASYYDQAIRASVSSRTPRFDAIPEHGSTANGGGGGGGGGGSVVDGGVGGANSTNGGDSRGGLLQRCDERHSRLHSSGMAGDHGTFAGQRRQRTTSSSDGGCCCCCCCGGCLGAVSSWCGGACRRRKRWDEFGDGSDDARLLLGRGGGGGGGDDGFDGDALDDSDSGCGCDLWAVAQALRLCRRVVFVPSE
ncbi:hypothetical protein PTSG_12574 [Salpingoeca rosetta]|uniref:EF-hand domain-containing protein n=1 Tax=Salpingoeca rosetta (strain ATCC 50818 / BSB-021) TaxID=946362 RepID=F2UJ50_SALR5|nr:uncharacterized protein PTSG_12574 [Salpingoeca rosetta]EGD76998.1 hypothetical protein PTSG_12574 [Salpingoeca rosetta]|eukprot:XP_004990838.1 hypothetical protein PTSG_12574 [Salpingoeca rosetta]